MKKSILFILFITICTLGCKKEPISTIKTLLIEKATETVNGKLFQDEIHKYDDKDRLIEYTFIDVNLTSGVKEVDVYNWTYPTNKVSIKSTTDSIDIEYIIVNNLAIQKFNKVTNERNEFIYDNDKLVEDKLYSSTNKLIYTYNYIYNSEGNLSKRIYTSSNDSVTKTYEYDDASKKIKAIQRANYGITYLRVDSKNPHSRETDKSNDGTILRDLKYTYETNSDGLIIKRTAKDMLNTSNPDVITTFEWKK